MFHINKQNTFCISNCALKVRIICLFSIAFYLVACISNTTKNEQIEKIEHFQIPEGNIQKISISNRNGMEVKVINYGATITQIIVPDRDGKFDDVVLGFDSVKNYITVPHPYFGSIIGRYANRIANAEFVINNDTFKLTPNNNGNSIHGGKIGFNKIFWDVIS